MAAKAQPQWPLRPNPIGPASAPATHASAFDLPAARAHWQVLSVACHCVAVADTVLPLNPHASISCERPETYALRVHGLFTLNARAMVVGALATMDEVTPP